MDKKLPGTVEERRAFSAWLNSQRKRKTKTCEMCPNEFDGLARRRYCSGACRIAAYRARRSGTQAPAMGETGRDINSADRSSAPGQGHSVSLEGHLVSPGGLVETDGHGSDRFSDSV